MDGLGRQTVEFDSLGKALTTSYDAVGRATRVVDRLGREMDFNYDNGDRVTLGVEDRLVLGGKDRIATALRVLVALFVDGEVERRLQGGQLVDVILEGDRQAQRVRTGRQVAVEIELVVRGQREAGLVGVAVDVVGFDTIAPLGLCERKASGHDGPHVCRAHVSRGFSRPPERRRQPRRH